MKGWNKWEVLIGLCALICGRDEMKHAKKWREISKPDIVQQTTRGEEGEGGDPSHHGRDLQQGQPSLTGALASCSRSHGDSSALIHY